MTTLSDPQAITGSNQPNHGLAKKTLQQKEIVISQFEISLKRNLHELSREKWVHDDSLLHKIVSVVGVIFHSLGALIYEGVDDCFETFSKHVTSVFQTTFLAEQHDDFNYILVALHLVNHLPIRQFENHKWIKSKQALDVTSLLLSDANLFLARSMAYEGQFDYKYYSWKRQILLEHLEKELQSASGSDKVFYKRCLTNLGQGDTSCSSDGDTSCSTSPDGNVYNRARDPPGLRSVYIPPGDSCQESYRLSTFLHFPDQVPVNPRLLASAGFLYTGYKDRVKCFSCGLSVEDWVVGDDVQSPRWHRSDCAHAHGGDSGNVPIGGDRGTRVQHTTPEQILLLAPIYYVSHEHFLKSLHLKMESARLRTYEHFPNNAPTVTTYDLARSGFFYLGNSDRVQCFSCGGVLRNWNYGDSVQSEHRRHFPSCPMLENNEPRNVPLTSDERAAIQQQTPIFTEPPDPPQAEREEPVDHTVNGTDERQRPHAGATQMNDDVKKQMDDGGGGLARFLIPTTAQTAPSFSNTPITAGHPSRTQTTPTTRSNPLLQSSYQRHQTARPPPQSASIYQIVEFATIASAYHEHFLKSIDLRKESERMLVQNNEPGNVPLTSDERAAIPQQTPIFTEPPDPPQAERQDLRAMFPCEYPVSPHMRNEDSRFQTFDERWSANNVQATPQQISKAGFFYLGERDRVKCWYCNGGLQNWDPQDEPWTEHAKWFPTCEFLLQRKGPDFVHRMVSMFPNLPRPLLRGPFDVPPTQGGTRIQFGSQSNRAPTPPPQIFDPQEEIRREQERVNAAMQLDIVKAALELGFADRLVRKVVKRRIHRTEMYRTTEDLVSDLTAESEVNDSDSEASNPASPDTESMQDRIRKLQEERKCKICWDRLADIVLVPCGHFCCCESCSQSLKNCPLCRKKIEKAIRTYMS